ncbi:MAG: hypothetical protein R3Y64_10505, partial [Peptostreptococcaceae bacterium]
QATFASLDKVIVPGPFTLAINDLFDTFYRQLKFFLGLSEIEELVFTKSVRQDTYWMGIMPVSWFKSTTMLHTICQVIAWTLMGASIVRMLLKKQLTTMNIGERVSLMEGFRDLIMASFLLGLTPFLLYTLAQGNMALVQLFESSSQFSGGLRTSLTGNSGALGITAINFAFLVLSIYYNALYILRGVTICILFAISPLCVFSLTLGGSKRQAFENFVRILTSQIFLQSIHALILSFFTSLSSTSVITSFELFMILVSIIPITGLVQEGIFGMKNDMNSVAQGTTSMGIGGAYMAAKGAGSLTKGAISGISSRSGGGSSGGGGGGGAGGSSAANSVQSAISSKSKKAMENKTAIPQAEGFMSNSKRDDFVSQLSNGVEGADGKIGTDTPANTTKQVYNDSGNKSTLAKKLVTSTAKNLGEGLKTAGGVTANTGLALGHAMMGDSKGATGYSMMAGKSVADTNFDYSAFKQSEEQKHGISQVHDGGDSMANVYKAKVDDDGNVNFSDKKLSGSMYEQNMQEAYQAFNGKGDYAEGGSKANLREEAVKSYKKQGINRVGKTKDGNLAINYSKDMANVKGGFSYGNLAPNPIQPSSEKSSGGGEYKGSNSNNGGSSSGGNSGGTVNSSGGSSSNTNNSSGSSSSGDSSNTNNSSGNSGKGNKSYGGNKYNGNNNSNNNSNNTSSNSGDSDGGNSGGGTTAPTKKGNMPDPVINSNSNNSKNNNKGNNVKKNKDKNDKNIS